MYRNKTQILLLTAVYDAEFSFIKFSLVNKITFTRTVVIFLYAYYLNIASLLFKTSIRKYYMVQIYIFHISL